MLLLALPPLFPLADELSLAFKSSISFLYFSMMMRLFLSFFLYYSRYFSTSFRRASNYYLSFALSLSFFVASMFLSWTFLSFFSFASSACLWDSSSIFIFYLPSSSSLFSSVRALHSYTYFCFSSVTWLIFSL